MPQEPIGQPSRKERERQAHRLEILSAAERVFVRQGFHATTIEQIAQEAQFAIGTLYKFFASKEELYRAVIQRIAQDFMDLFHSQVLTKEDPEQALRALIELRLTHFDQHRGFFRVFFEAAVANRVDPITSLCEQMHHYYEQYVDAVTGLFQKGISQGVFDAVDPLYLTLCLEGVINACVAYWSRSEPKEPLSTRIERMQHEFIERIKIRLAQPYPGYEVNR